MHSSLPIKWIPLMINSHQQILWLKWKIFMKNIDFYIALLPRRAMHSFLKRLFKKNDFIYFILFLAVMGLRCWVRFLSSSGMWASQHGGFSCCWRKVLGGVGFSNCSTWALQLWLPGTIAVARGLSCSSARGLFLDQGLHLCLLHWQADSLPLSHQGSPHAYCLMCGFSMGCGGSRRLVGGVSSYYRMWTQRQSRTRLP